MNKHTCFYNAIFTKFNENIEYNTNLYVSMSYPSYYKLKNCTCSINKDIIEKLNSRILLDINTFKDSISKEEVEENKVNIEQNQPIVKYKLISNYDTTFNKNQIISSKIKFMVFNNKVNDVLYDEVYNYNVDLSTGNTLLLKDVFMPNVDYLKVINSYIKYKINQNKDYFFTDAFVEATNDQAFYLTDDALIIYFTSGTIAPKEFDTIKFKMEYKKFLPYINPKLYCTPQNIE